MAFPKPNQWDIFWCYFPYKNSKPTEIHPVLVLDIAKNYSTGTKFLTIAGGCTIKNLGTLKPSEFYVLQADSYFNTCFGWNGSLTNDTKFFFDFDKILFLPYDTKHFKEIAQFKDGKTFLSPFLGNLPLEPEPTGKYEYLIERFENAVDNSDYEKKITHIENTYINNQGCFTLPTPPLNSSTI